MDRTAEFFPYTVDGIHILPVLHESLEFADCARRAMEMGDEESLGHRMDENHRLLQDMGVSSPQLDSLVEAARRGGALGAKLSGAGRGGNTIALVTPERQDDVEKALISEGAQSVIQTEIPATQNTSSRVASSIAP